PDLLIKDAPLEILTPDLKVTVPEIYYGEASHEPVFVRTSQAEFNYPSGTGDVSTRYNGRGGFTIPSLGVRVAPGLAEGDWNIVLSSALTPDSRMMIHRKVAERLNELAAFLEWDEDPYLVIGADGRLVWMIDGYTTSAAHPYSRDVRGGGSRYNYIRN